MVLSRKNHSIAVLGFFFIVFKFTFVFFFGSFCFFFFASEQLKTTTSDRFPAAPIQNVRWNFPPQLCWDFYEVNLGWMLEPKLNHFYIGVDFRQDSFCLVGLHIVTLKLSKADLNSDGCEDFNEYKPAAAKPCLHTKASAIKPFFSPFLPCASHVLYLIIYFPTVFCALTSILIRYRIKLDSDHVQYGGHGRLDHNTDFFTEPEPFNGRTNSMQVNISLFFPQASLTPLHPVKCTSPQDRCVYCRVCSHPPHPHYSTLHPASNVIAHLHRTKSLNQIISKMSPRIWKGCVQRAAAEENTSKALDETGWENVSKTNDEKKKKEVRFETLA